MNASEINTDIQLLPDGEIRYFIRRTLQVEKLVASIAETFNDNLSTFYGSPFARQRCEQAAIWVVTYRLAVAKRVDKILQRQHDLLTFIETLSTTDQSRFWEFCNNPALPGAFIADILSNMSDLFDWAELFESKPLIEADSLNTMFEDMLKELELE